MLKFDPIHHELYSSDGRLLKKMHCPFRMDWNGMKSEGSASRRCQQCDHEVIDTAEMSEKELEQLLTDHPATCLKVDLQQGNLKIIMKEDEYNGK